ncbi:hypothetical protein LEMLEM_LOCUS25147 [Lemmus lemmus]
MNYVELAVSFAVVKSSAWTAGVGGGGGCGCCRRWLKKGGGGGCGEGWERPGFGEQARAAELSWGYRSTEEKGERPGGPQATPEARAGVFLFGCAQRSAARADNSSYNNNPPSSSPARLRQPRPSYCLDTCLGLRSASPLFSVSAFSLSPTPPSSREPQAAKASPRGEGSRS